MTTLREAAQQALEYLDAPPAILWPAGTHERIITALRAALAQQAEPTPPDATAGLVDDLCLLHMGWKTDADADLLGAAWGRVIARAKQLKAQVGKGEEK